MGEAQREHDCAFALHLHAIADADDLEFLLPAVGYAFYGVEYQRARESMYGRLRIILAGSEQMSVLLLELDSARDRCIQLAFGSLHRDQVALDVDLHSTRHRDRFFSNSRHIFL